MMAPYFFALFVCFCCFVGVISDDLNNNAKFNLSVESFDIHLGWTLHHENQTDDIGGYIVGFSKVSTASGERSSPDYVKLIGSHWYEYSYGQFEAGSTYYGEIEVTDRAFQLSHVLGQFYITMPNYSTDILPQSESSANQLLRPTAGVHLDAFTTTIKWEPLTNTQQLPYSGYYIEMNEVDITGKLSYPYQHVKFGTRKSSCRLPGLKPGFVYHVYLRGVYHDENITDSVLAQMSIFGGSLNKIKENILNLEEYKDENGINDVVLDEHNSSHENAVPTDKVEIDSSPSKYSSVTCFTQDGVSYEGFKCSENVCVPAHWVCDGDRDCKEGEDETICNSPPLSPLNLCKESEFSCGKSSSDDNKQCIPLSWLCDGDADCTDGGDEDVTVCSTTFTTCPKGQFKCPEPDGACIQASLICDGVNNCLNGADEDRCTHEQCEDEQFTCGGLLNDLRSVVRCIPTAWVCDGDVDCPNADDENKCSYNQNNKVHHQLNDFIL